MKIAEIRLPPDQPKPAATPRPSFFLTQGSVPPTPYPWLADQQAILQPDEVLLQQPPRSIYFPLTGGVTGVKPFFFPSVAVAYEPTFLGGGSGGNPPDAQLYINGVLVQWLANPGDAGSTGNLVSGVAFASPTITKTLGQTGSMTFAFLSTNGSLPAAYQDVVFYRHGIRRFGGYVVTVTDAVLVGTTLREYGVACVDYTGLLDRIVIAKYYSLPQSGIISIVLLDFVTSFLAQYGVTFNYFEFGDPDVQVGPLLFHYILLSAAITQLIQQASGWYVYINVYKQLIFQEQGAGPTAPYEISDANNIPLIGPGKVEAMAVTQDQSEYRNQQFVLPSVQTQSLTTDSFTADGVTTAFFTSQNLIDEPIVTVNGNAVAVTALGSWDVPFAFYYIPGGQGVFQNPANPPYVAGTAIQVIYPAQFQAAAMAENAVEIARVGVVASYYQPTDVVTQEEAQNIADALLAAYCPSVPSQVEYNTNEWIETAAGGWVELGMMLTVATTAPLSAGAGNPYLIQSITSQENNLTVWKHNVIARLQNGATDSQTMLAKITKAALTAAANTKTETATLFAATTVGGAVNPGLAGGAIPSVYIFSAPGVFSSWQAIFLVTPALHTGSAAIIDIQLNGNSILPPGSSNKVIIEPGSANVVISGWQFSTINLPYKAGDYLQLYCLTAGSGTFTDGTFSVVGLPSN